MPFPPGSNGYNPVAGGNIDFGLVEGVSALQRNPQVRRLSGFGVQSFTGSVIYGVIVGQNTVQVSDSASFLIAGVPGIVVPFGIPTGYPATGGSLTVTPANSSTGYCVLYK
jgi:hypothetical protein